MIALAAIAVAGPVFVTETSTLETVVFTLAKSFSGFGSPVADTVATFMNVEPDAVPGGM